MIVAIIQARMGSTRLPGKVLMKAGGKTLLEHLVRRVKRARTLDAIVVATTENLEDDAIAALAKKLLVGVFRGSEHDVLDRYYRAAEQAKADTVVRLTGDCPLMDPQVIDRVVSLFKKNQRRYDYVSNVRPPTFPDGMDVEVFSFKVLQKMWREAELPSEREHVTAYIANHPELFAIGNVRAKKDFSHLRLTVDTPADLTLISSIITAFAGRKNYPDAQDIVAFLKRHPNLIKSNQHIGRNEGYAKSLREDPKESVTLRKAVMADARFLYELRNEKAVKSASFSTEAFSFASHRQWFRKKLADRNSLIYIAKAGGASVGQVRFDARGKSAEVSVAVGDAHRGLGYGSRMVRSASKRFFSEYSGAKKIHAYIKPENEASKKVFGKAGFRLAGSKTVKGTKCIDMVLTSNSL
ncbi:MAG: GNAT family N-acetyltransferase [bacterium]|nr:GNAT family N-acetyltransferase [bacterium]